MGKEAGDAEHIRSKELMLREAVDGYIGTVVSRLEALEKRDVILQKYIIEQKQYESKRAENERISQARGVIIKELLKKDPGAVQLLLVQVIKQMQLSKEEAKKVLTD